VYEVSLIFKSIFKSIFNYIGSIYLQTTRLR